MTVSQHTLSPVVPDADQLIANIRKWAAELGFQQVGIADCDLSEATPRLQQWLARGWNGNMEYMSTPGTRTTPPRRNQAGLAADESIVVRRELSVVPISWTHGAAYPT